MRCQVERVGWSDGCGDSRERLVVGLRPAGRMYVCRDWMREAVLGVEVALGWSSALTVGVEV